MVDVGKIIGSAISQKFSLGENENRSLDIASDGNIKQYGKLGDFANKFDATANRKYTEKGYFRTDYHTAFPQQFEIIMQQPETTVLVKKKMFSVLAENFNSDYMDKDEKLFYKASKLLFANKCKQISAYEKLIKFAEIIHRTNTVQDEMMPLLISFTDTLVEPQSVSSTLLNFNNREEISPGLQSLKNVIDKIRKVYAFTNKNYLTTWHVDNTNLFQSRFGEGTGVIELTNVSSFNSTVGLDSGRGGFEVSDPYNLMRITDRDIELAISQATNFIRNSKLFNLGLETQDQIIAKNIERLNTLRANRGVSNIVFKFNPDTVYGKRVTAIIEGLGLEIPFKYNPSFGLGGALQALGVDNAGTQVPDEYFEGGEIAGPEGLSTKRNKSTNGVRRLASQTEMVLFQDVVNAFYNKIQVEANSQNSLIQRNKETNYVRRKMYMNFLGKTIIQPKDEVHIYVSSKSKPDTKILAGIKNAFKGNNFFARIKQSLGDLKNSFNALNDNYDSVSQIEKAAFVGESFPNFLWQMMRSHFIDEREGTHVFAGIVEEAAGRFSNGVYTVDVSLADNMNYLEQGMVNFKPSVDVYNGALFDPITPFKSRFDEVSSNKNNEFPELLDENKQLLNKIKYKAGRNVGKKFEFNDLGRDVKVNNRGIISTKFYAPDGLVYRWKEGISTFTQLGQSFDRADSDYIGNPNIYENYFAGQDILNAISLMITGQPYNYITYLKAINDLEYLPEDPTNGRDGTFAFMQSLQNSLAKRNSLWGNFIPYKTLTVNETETKSLLKAQKTILNNTKNITETLQEINDLYITLASNGINSLLETNVEDRRLADTIKKIKDKFQSIETQSDEIVRSYKDNKNNISILGDDLVLNTNDLLGVNSNRSNEITARELRRKVNYLTRRMSWAVRANEDKNLFIVDDSYDADLDLSAFTRELAGNLDIFNNQFTTVRDKLLSISHFLDLEVFCDTQGHIRVRFPQYNRIPSSVFINMLRRKSFEGVEVYPKFIDNLFVDKLQQLRQTIEVLEDEIRLRAGILGYFDDRKIESFIRGAKDSGSIFVGGESLFQFISDSDGQILSFDSLTEASAPENLTNESLDNSFNNLAQQAENLGVTFSVVQKQKALLRILSRSEDQATASSLEQENLTKIKNRITSKTGFAVNLQSEYANNQGNIISGNINYLKVLNEISEKISARQRALKELYGSIKNLRKLRSLDDSKTINNELSSPNFFSSDAIPTFMDNLIEDENYHDLGPGSGSRYIITNSQIISYNISEKSPPYTYVQVQGKLSPFLPNVQVIPTSTGAGDAVADGLTSATAIDNDLWRMYGFKASNSITVPFFTSAEAQCAPYAVTLLSKARKMIFQGDMTIVGNEYMQPGEVVYVEHLNMLFYVNSVSHNFSYGSQFTTSLNLTYGHSPGEYIPNSIDIIGKILYNNRDRSNLVVDRQSNVLNESSLGIFILDDNMKLDSIADKNKPAAFFGKSTSGDHNRETLNKILFSVRTLLLNNQVKSGNQTFKVQLRVYSQGENSQVQEISKEIIQILRGNKSVPNARTEFNNSIKNLAIDPNDKSVDVNVEYIDLNNEQELRSPSQKALSVARDFLAKYSNKETNVGQSSSKLNAVLANQIIDCFVVSEYKIPETN